MSDLTRAEAIAELTEHLNHWKRLLKEGICGKEQGERTIKSLEFAIDSLKTDSTIKEAYDKGYKDGQEAHAVHLELCKEEEDPKVEKVIKMRDATPEEQKSVDDYIKNISKPTGADFWDLEQEPCEDCISRVEARKHIYQRLYESALNNVGYECKAEDVFMDIADNRLSTWISEIPSIQPKSKTDVLDKIRAEIKEESKFCPFTEGLERALEIIDKYKAESEETDADSN